MDEAKEVRQIPIEDIIPNRFQPRINFDEKALNELAESIKQHGIIQPLVLRPLGDKFEIIAGERRYKAATLAGLSTVPGIVTEMDDNTSAEVALIENVQRKDLSSIEEAKSYKNMLERSNMTQEELAKKMGLSQSTIANKLRLLNLSEEVQNALTQEKISERHARALLSIQNKDEQVKWLNRIINERLTVRQLDLAIKDEQKEQSELEGDIPKVNINPDIDSIINNAVDINITGPKSQMSDTNNILSDAGENEEPVKTTNKFFNYLEDQEVNMSTTEEATPSAPNEVPSEVFNFTPEFNNAPENQFVPQNEEEIETLDDIQPQVVPENSSIQQDEPIFKEGNLNNTPEIVEELPEQELIEPVVNEEPIQTQPAPTSVEPVQNVELVQNVEPIQKTEPEPVSSTAEVVPQVENTQIVSESMDTTQKDSEIEEFVFEDEDEDDSTSGGIVENTVLPSEEMQETNTNSEPEERIQVDPIPIAEGNGVIDPVSFYDTLDPDFIEKAKEYVGLDLKKAISSYRDLTEELNSKGFSINIDETDLDSKYLIDISINKE